MSVLEQQMAQTRQKLIEVGRLALTSYGYVQTFIDKLTAEVGLTRGALYHHFGDKKGLFAAVVDQIDSEMAGHAQHHLGQVSDLWEGLMLEGHLYIESVLNPEFQQIVLRDGPAVLGDPAHWPSQNQCLQATKNYIEQLLMTQRIHYVDATAAYVFFEWFSHECGALGGIQ